MATAAPSTDDRIYHPLDRLRGTIRRFVAVDGLLAVGLLLAGWFWAGLAADYGLFELTGFDWVQDAPRAVRAVALAALAAAAAGLLVSRIVRRLRREFSYPALALVLEKRYPAILGDRLITAVELADVDRQVRYGYSADMIRETIADAKEAVARVPVGEVFHWRRLWLKAGLLGAVLAGGVAACFGLFAAARGSADAAEFAGRGADVAAIWGERNLLLMNTPWPRRAYLELVDFPAEELRVGKDAPPPRVRARAYQWVKADHTTRDGWRPLIWGDVLGLVRDPKLCPVYSPVERTDPAAIGEWMGGDPEMFWAGLEQLAASPRMSRSLRKLVIPADVTLHYTGTKTGGTVSLTREPSGDFTGEVAGLKESVRFTVRGEDFATAPRRITLVPPPTLVKLTRTEREPAYLSHPAPADGTFADLSGLRQLLAEKNLSLTGDKSVCTVPAGTEVVVAGTADKPLREVRVVPKQGRVPGAAAGKPVVVPVAGGDAFAVRFEGDDRVTQTVEFDLVLIDPDGVTSTRPVVIQATEDQPPEVRFAADVLRKQGGAYLCTPIAAVPFDPESFARDDAGLSRVGFEFTAARVEGAVVVGLQAQAAAGVWAGAPLLPSFGSVAAPAAGVSLATALSGGGTRTTGTAPLGRFDEAYARLPRDTKAALGRRLGEPADRDRDEPRVVRQVKGFDAFDLRQALPGLRATSGDDLQPRYRVEVNVVAADTNVDTGPKRGQGVEPVRLLVISEQDLLAEISKDEEVLITRLDEVLKRVREAQTKLGQSADRVAGPAPVPDQVQAAAVRTLDSLQDLGKGAEGTTGVVGEYRRLAREAEVNRVNEAVAARFEAAVVRPLDAILAREFPEAEAGVAAFQAPLAAGRRPADPLAADARAKVAALVERLAAVRAQLGEALSINKLRGDLDRIIKQQLQVSAALKALQVEGTNKLFAPSVKPVPPVVLAKGEAKKVRHAVDWNVFEGGQVRIKLETPAGAEVRGPAEVVVADDKNDFEYELRAGDKPGEYVVRLVPSVGAAVEVRVTVK